MSTHFLICFLGWMPRSWSEKYLRILNKSKNYENMPDMQRISEMHYYTLRQFMEMAESAGFEAEDTRENKAKIKGSVMGLLFYRMFRPWYFSTFHLLLKK